MGLPLMTQPQTFEDLAGLPVGPPCKELDRSSTNLIASGGRACQPIFNSTIKGSRNAVVSPPVPADPQSPGRSVTKLFIPSLT
jgi:hypothetical protein